MISLFSGKFDPSGIKCSSLALEESKRLQCSFDEKIKITSAKKDGHWKISYLNVKSLYAHCGDVVRDNIMMDSDLISLGETWLHFQSEVSFSGFKGYFANFGRGKGVAAFTKCHLDQIPYIQSSDCHSLIQMKMFGIDFIFVYISHNCDRKQLIHQLFDLMNSSNPTVLMGDFNEKYSKSSNMSRDLETRNFSQLISTPTHDKGNLIDHLYVNDLLLQKGHFIEKNAAYYSDHDIITLYIKK